MISNDFTPMNIWGWWGLQTNLEKRRLIEKYYAGRDILKPNEEQLIFICDNENIEYIVDDIELPSDSKILSFIKSDDDESRRLFELKSDGKYHFDEESYSIYQLLNDNSTTIFEIQDNDGVNFKVGDRIFWNWKKSNYNFYTISKIVISEGLFGYYVEELKFRTNCIIPILFFSEVKPKHYTDYHRLRDLKEEELINLGQSLTRSKIKITIPVNVEVKILGGDSIIYSTDKYHLVSPDLTSITFDLDARDYKGDYNNEFAFLSCDAAISLFNKKKINSSRYPTIISFKRNNDGDIFKVNDEGFYENEKDKFGYCSLDNMLHDGCCVDSGEFIIYQVAVDANHIFTVGDKLIYKNDKNSVKIIKNFGIGKQYPIVFNFENDKYTGGYDVKILKNYLIKNPIFITLDKIAIYSGDTYWYVANKKGYVAWKEKKCKSGSGSSKEVKYFGNKENLIRYLNCMNVPKYNDINKHINHNDIYWAIDSDFKIERYMLCTKVNGDIQFSTREAAMSYVDEYHKKFSAIDVFKAIYLGRTSKVSINEIFKIYFDNKK